MALGLCVVKGSLVGDLPPSALCKLFILAENSSYNNVQEVGMLLLVPASSISLNKGCSSILSATGKKSLIPQLQTGRGGCCLFGSFAVRTPLWFGFCRL